LHLLEFRLQAVFDSFLKNKTASRRNSNKTKTMIRPATPEDVPAIAMLIRALAEYEKLTHEVVLNEADLREHLFGPRPYAEVWLAEHDTRVVGFMLFFMNYSTFLAKPGIYLEDVFVLPEFRGFSHGKAMLKQLGQIAQERKCGRIEWAVLDWNAPAIGFYTSLGAKPMDEWTTMRLTGEAIGKLADS
jgi:GNAT superfamily N-acetyltransferase